MDNKSTLDPNAAGGFWWVDTKTAAALLGVSEQCLRSWRVADRRAGRGDGIPGRGGLLWRRFGYIIRYSTASLLPRPVTEPQPPASPEEAA